MADKTGGPKTAQLARPQLSILVPVYNEEKTILKILKKVTALPINSYEILVVDDASHDTSKAIIDKFKRSFTNQRATLRVLSHAKNRGKGAGIKTALEHARGEYFIIQDADLEYDPADIPSLLAKALKDDLPVVYGSRFQGTMHNMPRANYYANKLYNFLLRRLYNTKITDMHTCYKMVKTNLLNDFNMQSEGFDYATELVSKILRRNTPIAETPISFNGRTKQQGKKIGVKDGLDCMYMMFKYRYTRDI
jgi:glycosyltransferase involved in cell wall biosynthesis